MTCIFSPPQKSNTHFGYQPDHTDHTDHTDQSVNVNQLENSGTRRQATRGESKTHQRACVHNQRL